MREATDDEIAQTIAFALRYEGRARVRDADEAMARIVAARLIRHLRRSGFVILKRPDLAPHTTPDRR